MMENNTIITIGRQFGSGGREVGQKLAESLNIPFYDRDLIALTAERSGYNKEVLKGADEKPGNPFLQSLAVSSLGTGSRVSLPTEITINDRVFFAQAEVIKSLADQGSCVIVGRCADYVLRDREQCVNLFLYADLEARVARIARMFSISENEARNIIIKTDKKRASYYNYYSNKEWNHVDSYDLTIDSTVLGIDGTVEVVRLFVQKKDREITPGI